MISAQVSYSIPIDLIIEILSRLPAKSIVRFRCVSKQWRFMFLTPYFTDLFLTSSLARPHRLLFAVKRHEDWCFFTSPQPQPQNSYEEKSSIVVAADFHMKFPGDTWPKFCDPVSGFIYFRPMCRLKKEAVICNPSTVQYASLRLPSHHLGLDSMLSFSFLGFDPVDKQFKVLYLTLPLFGKHEPDEILTLGTGNNSWRKINCPVNHYPSGDGICINGVLYYFALQDELPSIIVCFDVRSETFKFIHRDFIQFHYISKLINYKGKLGVITLECTRSSLKLCMYVIKDVEKPEWSEYFRYCWEDDQVVDNNYLSIVGVTAATSDCFVDQACI